MTRVFKQGVAAFSSCLCLLAASVAPAYTISCDKGALEINADPSTGQISANIANPTIQSYLKIYQPFSNEGNTDPASLNFKGSIGLFADGTDYKSAQLARLGNGIKVVVTTVPHYFCKYNSRDHGTGQYHAVLVAPPKKMNGTYDCGPSSPPDWILIGAEVYSDRSDKDWYFRSCTFPE